MQDTGSSRVRNNLKSQGSLPFFDKIRVDHILKLFGARDGAEVTVHVCVLDRELVLELECVLELLLEVLVLDLFNIDREATAVVTVPSFDGSGHFDVDVVVLVVVVVVVLVVTMTVGRKVVLLLLVVTLLLLLSGEL